MSTAANSQKITVVAEFDQASGQIVYVASIEKNGERIERRHPDPVRAKTLIEESLISFGDIFESLARHI